MPTGSRTYLQHVPRDVLLAAVTADAELGVVVGLAVGQPVPATSRGSGRAGSPRHPHGLTTLARERAPVEGGHAHSRPLQVTGPPSVFTGVSAAASVTTPAPRQATRTVPFRRWRNRGAQSWGPRAQQLIRWVGGKRTARVERGKPWLHREERGPQGMGHPPTTRPWTACLLHAGRRRGTNDE